MRKLRRNEIRLPIGEVARRTGLAVTAIRFYEEEGLIAPIRDAGGRRHFPRSDIRRLSFIRILQGFGFTLGRIREVLAGLPESRTPTPADWAAIADRLRGDLDQRIAVLQKMRNGLDGCIGCGCLSLDKCALYNPCDGAAAKGPGARYLMGDKPD
ncbi:MAG: redox-sensitive transcriptional activator SoxR [Pseudomonadota bacterium]